MRTEPLSLTLRTLHAELRELVLAAGARARLSAMPGSVVRKRIRGGVFVYYQYRDLVGGTRQLYLGPEHDGRIAALADTLAQPAEEQDAARIEELHAAYVAAGAPVLEHAPMRVLRAFATAGVLRPEQGSAVLVGTYAFAAYAHLLGVRWAGSLGTQDIDLAAHRDAASAREATGIEIALRRPEVSAPDALDQLEMGFLPVPALDPRTPSTSYKVRGQPMRVDLLAPAAGEAPGEPVFVPAFGGMAQPLPLLDYLLGETVAGLVVGRRELLVVALPAPERFALHKLVVARSRPAAFATKAAKDRDQAALVLAVLREEAPLGLRAALGALARRGEPWLTRLRQGMAALTVDAAEEAAWVQDELAEV